MSSLVPSGCSGWITRKRQRQSTPQQNTPSIPHQQSQNNATQDPYAITPPSEYCFLDYTTIIKDYLSLNPGKNKQALSLFSTTCRDLRCMFPKHISKELNKETLDQSLDEIIKLLNL